jgi:molecular chaperone GrpE
MSDETVQVKVNDRRRFDTDGTLRQEPESTPEAPSPEAAAPPFPASPELEAARKRIDELARAYQALERDREDFKRRLSREREQVLDVERAQVAQALLEAIDDLDLSLRSADDSPFAKGVRVIRGNLVKKVESLGLSRLELDGAAYDPNLAEAADLEVTGDPARDNVVTATLRAGYKLKDRLVRPARVRVARYVKPADA